MCNTASMETNKTCPVCGEPVPPSRGSRARIYCSNKCNIRAWREANPEKVNAYNREWREANPEKVKAKSRAWREANPEKVKAKSRAWREANPEKVKAESRAWSEANPEKVKERNRAWREANPEKVKERNRAKVENLSDAYVAKILRMKVSEVPQHLIELKREQLIYHRCTRQLTEALKEKKDDQ